MKSPSKTHLDRDARTLSRANEAYSAGAYRAAVKLFELFLIGIHQGTELKFAIGLAVAYQVGIALAPENLVFA